MKRIRSAIPFWFLPLSLAAAGEPAEKAPPPPRDSGISIEYPDRPLAEEERTPEGERKAILAAKAVLKTTRPIRYRSVVLPPGAYPLTIAADAAKEGNLFFVIGPAAASDEGGGTPEEKKVEREEEKAPAADRGGNGNGNGNENRKGDGRAAKKKPGAIRALFHIAAAKKPTEKVEFAVGAPSRENRFTLTIRAGSSQGMANLRLAD